ncbi:Peptidyl-tRNA hydrolase 2, mitochondrial [Porphyridium purpureum]|uniref:peptidyl-tRNA hydrolase n=1 Tax=Porphyridium purpureum TaxID=35688 RepID=A0A5J4Z8V8_PORPP|nr:Peptidyl-tRNA hydrolase 2, mitochondrial [Porphyridium purpureum]|eukprot:POR3687..scf295_1
MGTAIDWAHVICAACLGYVVGELRFRILKGPPQNWWRNVRVAILRFLRLRGQAERISTRVTDEDGRMDTYCKMVFCVRTDLKMGRGKIAAQVGHATLGAYQIALRHAPQYCTAWERGAQPKIALQINSESEAIEMQRKAHRAGLVAYDVLDAGKTQIAAGSLTVVAIGPGPAHLIDQITGKLKLL